LGGVEMPMSGVQYDKLLHGYHEERLSMRESAITAGVDYSEGVKALVADIRRITSGKKKFGRFSLDVRRAVLERYRDLAVENPTSPDVTERVGKEFGICKATIRNWLRPSYTRAEAAGELLIAADTDAAKTLIGALCARIASDDQVVAVLADLRQELARDLYAYGRHFYDAAAGALGDHKAGAFIRAAATAGHYAIHDGQILSGQATERFGAMFNELEGLSDDQLRAVVEGARRGLVGGAGDTSAANA